MTERPPTPNPDEAEQELQEATDEGYRDTLEERAYEEHTEASHADDKDDEDDEDDKDDKDG